MIGLKVGNIATEELLTGQGNKYGDVKLWADDSGKFVVGGVGVLYRVFGETDVRAVVPESLRDKALTWVHGSKAVGHLGVVRTAVRMKLIFWWPGWFAAVEERVQRSLACRMSKLTRTKLQARMQV